MGKQIHKYNHLGEYITTYSSQTQAAIDNNLSESGIRAAIRRNTLTKGHYWSNNLLTNYLTSSGTTVASIPTTTNNLPKVLFFDTEITPSKVYTFPVWNANISPGQIIEDWYMICWSAKWLGDTKVLNSCLSTTDVDDFNVISNLWKLLDEADIIVAHNAKFDIGKANARFIVHGLTVPSPYKVIDTLKIARSNFGFTYNKLDYISKILNGKGKIQTNFQLWVDCMNRKKEALEEMQLYCDNDVLELEDIYLKLRPFAKAHPSMTVLKSNIGCKSCGSDNLEYIKDTTTNSNIYKLYQCKDCKSWTRDNKIKK